MLARFWGLFHFCGQVKVRLSHARKQKVRNHAWGCSIAKCKDQTKNGYKTIGLLLHFWCDFRLPSVQFSVIHNSGSGTEGSMWPTHTGHSKVITKGTHVVATRRPLHGNEVCTQKKINQQKRTDRYGAKHTQVSHTQTYTHNHCLPNSKIPINTDYRARKEFDFSQTAHTFLSTVE